MAQFDKSIQTALRLIKKNGQKVDWITATHSIPDSTKPWLPVDNTYTTYQPFICFLPINFRHQEFFNYIKDIEAVTGKFIGLMGNVPFAPKVTDVVTRNGDKLDIDSIDLLSPNGQKVLYTIIFNG
ncbi:MAG: hypothetical protein V4493_01290 [Pseudomonadota bacterium]